MTNYHDELAHLIDENELLREELARLRSALKQMHDDMTKLQKENTELRARRYGAPPVEQILPSSKAE